MYGLLIDIKKKKKKKEKKRVSRPTNPTFESVVWTIKLFGPIQDGTKDDKCVYTRSLV